MNSIHSRRKHKYIRIHAKKPTQREKIVSLTLNAVFINCRFFFCSLMNTRKKPKIMIYVNSSSSSSRRSNRNATQLLRYFSVIYHQWWTPYKLSNEANFSLVNIYYGFKSKFIGNVTHYYSYLNINERSMLFNQPILVC